MSYHRVEEKIGVFLVAESPLARQGAYHVITQEGDIEVIGEAGNLDEPFTLAGDITSRTVVLQIISPQGSFEMVHRLREFSPELSIIVVAEYEDDISLLNALVAGASAFLTKEIVGEQLRSAIRKVANGEYLVVGNLVRRPRVASLLLSWFQERLSTTERTQPSIVSPSHDEDAVLRLIAEGNSIEAIAEQLGLSIQMIRAHVRSVLGKLKISERNISTAGENMNDSVVIDARDRVEGEASYVQQIAQEKAARIVANARVEIENLVTESIQRLEAEIEKQR